MRKLIGVGIIAALAVSLLAVPASASFDHHFSVIAKQVAGQQGHNTFRFRDHLLNPRNRHDRVGRDWGRCKFKHAIKKLRCHATVHLNGDIGGFGDINVSGDISRHDNRLNVVGGTHDFTAVAGKLLVRTLHEKNTNRLRFALTR
jgi:hypothetical protein